jgi:diadenosine tetraphosphate (Ap4A) HIT family hydrolase
LLGVVELVSVRDNEKRYRFTPSVSIPRMPDALSVDALCGFGAKIFTVVPDSYSLSGCRGRTLRAFLVISLCWIAQSVPSWCVLPKNVACRNIEQRLPGRAYREARRIRRYAACLSLGLMPVWVAAKLNCVDKPGVHAVFALDSRLQQDTLTIGDFPLCRLLLSNDANYPWFILVPRRDDISELFQLDVADQQQLWQETTALAELLKDLFDADKLNVATLGNVVSQLHMHVIVRKRDDAAWPAPVWGKHPARPYSAEEVAGIRERLRLVLTEDFTFLEG